MSYSIYLKTPKCDHCGRGYDDPRLPDPTYNLTPIFDLALSDGELPNPDTSEGAVVVLGAKTDRPRGLRLLSGLTGAASLPLIEAALTRMRDPDRREAFVAVEPDSGWGNFDGALRVMSQLRDAAEERPTAIWEIH